MSRYLYGQQAMAATAWSGMKAITCSLQNDSTYILTDPTKGSGIRTLHGDNGVSKDYTSKTLLWKYDNDDKYALDVHYGMSQCYLFFQYFFGRNSIDNKGHALISYVNYPIQDSRWDRNDETFTFGRRASDNAGLTCIDIIAHEWTHALLQYTAKLRDRDDAGAIGESICDIMGKAVQFWSDPSDTNWVIGNEMNFPLRDLSHPPSFKQPDTYRHPKLWYNGLNNELNDHINSGIGSFMFYLLVHGGKDTTSVGRSYNVRPISLEKAVRIIYETIVSGLTPTSDYPEWKELCVKAAQKLYGRHSLPARSVIGAWAAVGL